MTIRGLALAMMLTTLATTGTALAQGFGASPSDRVFQVTWNAATTKRGQPAVEGYVANQTGCSFRRQDCVSPSWTLAQRSSPTATTISGSVPRSWLRSDAARS